MIHVDKKMIGQIDWLLILLVVGLIAIGLVAIANATADPYQGTEEGLFGILERINPYYVRLQAIWVLAGSVLLVGVVLFDYHLYGELWFYIFLGCTALLILVWAIGGGTGGNTGWFQATIGGDLRQLQPAEFAKLAVIIVLAKQMTKEERPIRKVKELVILLIYLAVPTLLVAASGEYGSAMVYIAIFVGMLFMAGTSLKLIIGLATTGVLSLVPLWMSLSQWRKNRILQVLDPSRVSSDSSYQIDQSKIAIGSGQWSGKGLFREGAISQLDFVPAKHTDFIFSVTAESVGFIGCILIVALYFFLVIRLLMLAMKTTDRFGSLIIVGVASMFAFHIFENIGMNIGIMPIAGIPLPFMSYGGSSMLTNLAAIGLVCNVCMRPQKSYMT